jgi:NAD(P)-dependent dehydrogenase (short-subunit alcohol dehydrogenase family)
MTDLKGKTALVTGSTSGIGRATALALATRGAQVLVVGRNEQRAKDVVAEIEGSGGSATFRLTGVALIGHRLPVPVGNAGLMTSAAPGRLGTVPRRMGAMLPRAWRPAASARVRARSR